jgi:hypothetical protein
LIPDLAMRLGYQNSGLAAPHAAPLAPGEAPLRAAQVRPSALPVPGIVHFSSVRENGEAVEADVDTDGGGRLGQSNGFPFYGETHVPVVDIPFERDGFDLPLPRAGAVSL